MRTKKILLWIWFALSIVLLVGFMVVFPIILKKKWIWFWLPSIFISLSWIVIGIVTWINKWNAQVPPSTKIDPLDAVKKVIMMVKNDDDNGDNLEIRKKIILRLGRKDFEPTPILYIAGIGKEKGQKRVFLINLNNAEKEIGDLIEPTEEEIWKHANLMAEHPADSPITEKITESLKFGFPERTTERVIPSSLKDKEEKEKKEAEERSAS